MKLNSAGTHIERLIQASNVRGVNSHTFGVNSHVNCMLVKTKIADLWLSFDSCRENFDWS